MKINCACGAVIYDQTDALPHKAHIIGDKDYFGFLDTIDDAIESRDENKDKLCMEVRSAMPARLAWECNTCGRLYLSNGAGDLVSYISENGTVNRVFDRSG